MANDLIPISNQTELALRRTDMLISITNKLLAKTGIKGICEMSDDELWEWWLSLDDKWKSVFIDNLKKEFNLEINSNQYGDFKYFIPFLSKIPLIKNFRICDYVSGTSPLSILKNIEFLDLGDYDGYLEVDTLKPLLNFKKLKSFSFWYLDNKHIKELCEIKWLERLSIGDWGEGSGITNLDFLEFLPNIHSLMVYANYSIDIQGLNYANNLTFLGLTDINLSAKNINIIFNCLKLESLYLGRCVTNLDILPFEKLPNLVQLILYDNEIQDISALANLTQLTYLNLDGNPLSEDIYWLYQRLPNCEIVFSSTRIL